MVTQDGGPVADARLTFTNTTEVNGKKDVYSTTTDKEGK